MSTVTIIPAKPQVRTDSQGNIPPKLRVAAYARVSTDHEEQATSYEAQVEYYTHYIQTNPEWEFVGIFADEGITGTNTKKREGFNKMISSAKAGEIDLILTKSISRFARNTVDTLQTVRDLKALGVEVIFEKENLHTLDPKCEIMLTIMSSLAQEESRSISENIRWSMQKNMEQGKVSFNYKYFLGYRKGPDGRPEIVEEEAEIVREIYRLFLDGKGFREIARILTERQIPTPAGKTTWACSTVRSILSNEKYKGDALLQKHYTVDFLTKEQRKNKGERTQYYIENSHPAIIDRKTFDYVQEEIERRLHPYQRYTWGEEELFRDKIICSCCGKPFLAKRRDTKNGTKFYWHCSRKYKSDHRCTTPIIQSWQVKKALENYLISQDYQHPDFTEQRWRKMIDHVLIADDDTITLFLMDGTSVTTPLAK